MKGLESFGELKPPVKAAVAVASGGGLMGGLYALFGPGALPMLAVGIALIAMLFVGYRFLMKWLDKRNAAPMERAVKSSASATPTGITEPAKRARLDDLRKNFDSGIEKFRAAGKNLYSLPWYVLVGEPGSGKTEAIRRSNVGFPPGLQDQLQGAGGTVNMNWWFTNHAIIVDTAGRLMFEEVEPGATSEWQEFLKLIKKIRPNCPLNGMLLVIPAESLIRDTADAIERKGGKIAQQLDQIQRTLGVRFPVFVVVTKCDLINGFREFFDEVTDPMLQHQMLGWSNPGSLDTAFQPELVDQHLKTVQERLLRRRLTLMQDPVNTENQSARRTDQVDALFAFPESLMKIAPRLRRYLEMIFVAGEWSSKPLFLRGIYFTSSMREGAALDADLADALGMPVESLPEGKVWERERAFFLRDIFLSKVFPERGLVTKASNTASHLKKRQAIVYGTAAVGSLALLGFTIFAARDLSRRIAGPAEFWERTSKVYMTAPETPVGNIALGKTVNDTNLPNVPSATYFTPIVYAYEKNGPPFTYPGGTPRKAFEDISSSAANVTAGSFPVEIQRRASAGITVPWVFSVWAMATGGSRNIDEKFRDATGVIVEESVLRPTVEAARLRLNADIEDLKVPPAADQPPKQWTSEATDALGELLALEAACVKGAAPAAPIKVSKMLPYAITARPYDTVKIEDYAQNLERARNDAPRLDEVVAWTYSPQGGKQPWPSHALVRVSTVALVQEGVKRFTQSQGFPESSPGLGGVIRLLSALEQLEAAEKALHEVRTRPPAQQPTWWAEKFAVVMQRSQEVTAQSKLLGGRTLSAAYDAERKTYLETVRSSHKALLSQLAPVFDDEGATLKGIKKDEDDKRLSVLEDVQDSLRQSLKNAELEGESVVAARKTAAQYDLSHFKAGAGAQPAYLIRVEMYQSANKIFQQEPGERDVKIGALPARLQAIAEASKTGSAEVVRLGNVLIDPAPDAPAGKDAASLFSGARESAARATVLGGTQRTEGVVSAWIAALAGSPDQMMQKASELVALKENKWEVLRPVVPMTAAKEGDMIEPGFVPRAAAAVLKDCDAVAKIVAGTGEGMKFEPSSTLVEQSKALKEAAAGYGKQYMAYWKGLIGPDLAVRSFTWDDGSRFVHEGADARSVNKPLNDLGTLAIEAFDMVDGLVVANDDGATPAQSSLAIKSSLSNFKDPTFTEPIGVLFGNWGKLSPTAATARSTVLGKYKDRGLIPAYVWTVSELKKRDFVEKYWADFSLKMLTALANAAGNEVPRAMGVLRGLKRFPIVRPRQGEAELTPDDVNEARENLRIAQAAKTTGDAAAPAATIATLPAEVQKQIDELEGVSKMGEADRILMGQFEVAFAAIPRNVAETVRCEKIEKSEPPEKTSSATATWRLMSISRGNAPPGPPLYVHNQKLLVAADIAYPSPDQLQIQFYPDRNAGVDQAATISLPGQWAPLHLLLGDRAVQVLPDPSSKKVWYVELKVGANDQTMWLKLTFDRDLPSVPAWRGEK